MSNNKFKFKDMNFIKGVLGLGKRENQPENFLDFKSEGRLFLIQNGARKCVFIFCAVSFIQGKKDPYERYIYIRNLSDESEFNTNEYYFLIKEDIHFRSYSRKEEEDEVIGFEWDLDNGVTVVLEFGTHINDDLSSAARFKRHVCWLLHEYKYGQSAEFATEEELDQLCEQVEAYENPLSVSSNSSKVLDSNSNLYKPRQNQKKPEWQEPTEVAASILKKPVVREDTLEWNQSRSNNPLSDQSALDDLVRNFDKVDIQARPEERKVAEPERQQESFSKYPHLEKVSGKSLIDVQVALCELNESGHSIVLVPNAKLQIVNADNYEFYLEIFNDRGEILYKKLINNSMNYHVDDEQSSFKWVEIVPDTLEIRVYACKIPGDIINSFKLVLAQCLFETTNKESVEEVFKKQEEREYARRWFENDIDVIEEVKSQKDDEIEIEDDYFAAEDSPGGQNTGQAQAKLLDRTFVSKGSKISVYMTNEDDNSLEHIVSLPTLKTLGDTEFMPKKMMMHEQDTKMLILSDPMDTKVYYMDLARGKIINEYEGDGVNRFTDIAPTSKHSEFTHNPCFMTSNQRNLFLFDPRVAGDNKSVAEKIYAQAPRFTCITTHSTENAFATGSEKGEIRLFKEVGQNAKTLFPGLGDPIIGLDSTLDGHWLLATTKNYLMLVQTVVDGKSGYKQSISKDRRVPFKLTILPHDMKKYKISEIDFQPAKFNDSEKDGEKCIIASTGQFLVSWTLKHVFRGQLNKYEIKRLSDFVVSNEFRYKKEDNLLVTLPKEVRIQKTRFH